MSNRIWIQASVEFDLTAFNEVHDEHGRFGESSGSEKETGGDKTDKGPGSGKEAKTPRVADTRVKIEKRETGPKDEARSDRAKNAYDAKKSNVDVQRYGEAQERNLIEKIGGVQGGDNGAVDVVRRVGGIDHGLEVKTIVNKGGPNKSGGKAQIKMEPDQKTRKDTWVAQKDNRRSGVIVMDHRDRATDEAGEFIGNKEAYSGHDLHYRRDYGAHRIGAMYKVQSASELKMLMGKTDDELRGMMKAEPKRWNGVIGKKAKA